jgi:sirohydrochlorin cobaltochelatase
VTVSPPRTLLSILESWLAAGGSRVGEAVIRREPDGSFRIRHHEDSAVKSLTISTTPEAAREIAKFDAAGDFRPLKSAPSLIRGWEIVLPDTASLMLALDFLYPAALANWLRWLDGEAAAVPLRETLGRQTGIYRVTALLHDDEAAELVADTCGGNCLRRVMWPPDTGQTWRTLTPEKQSAPRDGPECGGVMPLLCIDPCPILIGGARTVVRRRMKSEAGPAPPEAPGTKLQAPEKLQAPSSNIANPANPPIDTTPFDV